MRQTAVTHVVFTLGDRRHVRPVDRSVHVKTDGLTDDASDRVKNFSDQSKHMILIPYRAHTYHISVTCSFTVSW